MEMLLLARRMVQDQGARRSGDQELLSALLRPGMRETARQKFVAAMVELAQAVVIKTRSRTALSPGPRTISGRISRKDISLEEVARTVGISPYYFSKLLFKEEAGMNFTEYLTGIRIRTAAAAALGAGAEHQAGLRGFRLRP